MIGAAVTASWASRCAVSLLSLLLSPTFRRRWVMSTTTHVSPVSGVPGHLADQAKASPNVAGVPRRLPRPAQSR